MAGKSCGSEIQRLKRVDLNVVATSGKEYGNSGSRREMTNCCATRAPPRIRQGGSGLNNEFEDSETFGHSTHTRSTVLIRKRRSRYTSSPSTAAGRRSVGIAFPSVGQSRNLIILSFREFVFLKQEPHRGVTGSCRTQIILKGLISRTFLKCVGHVGLSTCCVAEKLRLTECCSSVLPSPESL